MGFFGLPKGKQKRTKMNITLKLRSIVLHFDAVQIKSNTWHKYTYTLYTNPP